MHSEVQKRKETVPEKLVREKKSSNLIMRGRIGVGFAIVGGVQPLLITDNDNFSCFKSPDNIIYRHGAIFSA